MPTVFALAYVHEQGRLVPAPGTLIFRRAEDGRLYATRFPDAIEVQEELVRLINPRLVWLERGKLSVSAANGEAVYVPVGESPMRGCVRYGRLYLRTGQGR